MNNYERAQQNMAAEIERNAERAEREQEEQREAAAKAELAAEKTVMTNAVAQMARSVREHPSPSSTVPPQTLRRRARTPPQVG